MGVLFDGIKKLPAEHVGMKKELLLQWMAESQLLELSLIHIFRGWTTGWKSRGKGKSRRGERVCKVN